MWRERTPEKATIFWTARSEFLSRMNKDELSAMKRSELQKEAKKLGIKANQASNMLIQQILEKNNVRSKFECYV